MKSISFEKYKTTLKTVSNFEFGKVNKRDLAVFCKLFYTMLNAGISITQSLEIISENMRNRKLKKGLIDINRNLYKGLNLSEAMGKQDKIFPSFFVEMVRAGELSGNMQEITKRLGDYYEEQSKIESRLKSSLMYPITLIILSIIVVIFMLSFVFPLFYDLLSISEVNLPLPTRILMLISNLINNYWHISSIITLAVILCLSAYMKTKNGVYIKDYIKLRTPYFNRLYKSIISANFTKTLSLLLSSGIPLIKSLEITSKVLRNTVIQDKLKIEISNVVGGKSLSNAIRSLEIFPSIIHSMVKIGEESGALDELLLKASQYYDEEVRTSIEGVTKLIEPVLMIFIGLIVGFIVISIILPIFDIIYTI